MTRIVLVAVNARYSHTNIAIRYLRNSLFGLDCDVRLMEFTINQAPGDIVGAIAREGPDMVALSVYIWNAPLVGHMLSLITERLPRCLIVLGGPEVSYSHELWLKAHPRIDCVIAGPGEAAFRELVGRGSGRHGPVMAVDNAPFDDIPFPYTDEDLSGMRHRTVYYESSRGCSHRCAYCLSSRWDCALEFRSCARVKDELAFIMKHAPRYVKFVDRTFNCDRGRSRELWAHIMDNYGATGTLFHFEVNPALLGDEDFDLLGSCSRGLFQFELGVQSTNERALRAVDRPGDWALVRENIDRLAAMKTIHTHVDLIAGLPHEDWESLRRSFNDIYRLGADHFQPGLLKILHGTAMKEIAGREGYVYSPDPPYQVKSTPWLSAESVVEYECIAFLVERLYNGGHFALTLEELIKIFPSPYDCYRDLQAYYRALQGPPLDRGRESCAVFLARYVQSGRMSGDARGREAFLLDCIRWDWCRRSRNRHYPRLLRDVSTRRAAKKFMAMAHLFMKEGGPACPPLSGREVKLAMVFSPATREFGERFMGGHELAVFVPERPGPLLV
jgi:radical SAM superfamily enzyme YgiQ (UPF0313 family)